VKKIEGAESDFAPIFNEQYCFLVNNINFLMNSASFSEIPCRISEKPATFLNPGCALGL
jgi:hypothetical protein